MNIEKRKITEAKPLPVAAKSAITAALGLTVASTFIACGGDSIPNDFQDPESSDDSTLTSSDTAPTPASEDSQPNSSSATASDEATPESSSATEPLQSSSEQTAAQQSSSSQVVVDIPLSHEHISSSVMEALSAAAESSSSATKTDSSAATESSSSSFDHYQGECPDGPLSPTCNLKYCETPDGPCTPVVSMVTTFERTDIEV